jgi:hypothetical protein
MPSTLQRDLPLFLIKPDHPNVAFLVETLKNSHNWIYAGDILRSWGCTDTEHNRRTVRALAEAALPEIISGQLGYKWIGNATPEEIHHAASWLEAQAKKMSERACAIRKRAHQRIG